MWPLEIVGGDAWWMLKDRPGPSPQLPGDETCEDGTAQGAENIKDPLATFWKAVEEYVCADVTAQECDVSEARKNRNNHHDRDEIDRPGDGSFEQIASEDIRGHEQHHQKKDDNA